MDVTPTPVADAVDNAVQSEDTFANIAVDSAIDANNAAAEAEAAAASVIEHASALAMQSQIVTEIANLNAKVDTILARFDAITNPPEPPVIVVETPEPGPEPGPEAETEAETEAESTEIEVEAQPKPQARKRKLGKYR